MADQKNMQKRHRGFAAMDEEQQREIASKGGRAAHEKGTAHEFTSEEAREAGRKGGQARSESNRNRQLQNSGNSGSSTNSGSNGLTVSDPAQGAPRLSFAFSNLMASDSCRPPPRHR